MCEIKKINILKKRQQQVVEKFNAANPLSILPNDYVSTTGLTLTDLQDKINKIAQCASIIELKESFVEKDHSFEQVMSVAAANFCKQHTICPICADRMQARRRAKFNDPIKQQASLVTNGARHAYMITYTVADGGSLSERLDHLKDSKKSFRKMGQLRRNSRSRGESGKIKAAISTIEIKRGKYSHEWHVHCHDLVFTDAPLDYTVYDQDIKKQLHKRYGKRIPADILNDAALQRVKFQDEIVPASKMSREWFRATGGDSMSISVDPIRHVPKNAHGKKKRMFEKFTYEESVAYQAREVLKYISKPTENNTADSLIILNETYNKRMTATYGEFRGSTTDDYNDERDPESENYVMVWKNGKYSDAQPGEVRSISDDPLETEARSKTGKTLGEYRRRRRILIDQREKFGPELHIMLDELKIGFKQKIGLIWRTFRSAQSTSNAIKNSNCDKYSPIIALTGLYLPGSTSSDIYQAAFV